MIIFFTKLVGHEYHLVDDMVLSQNPENSDFLLEIFLSPSFSAPVSIWPRFLRNE